MVGSKGIESKIKHSLVLVHRRLDPVAHTLNPGPHARGVPGDNSYLISFILLKISYHGQKKRQLLVRNENKEKENKPICIAERAPASGLEI